MKTRVFLFLLTISLSSTISNAQNKGNDANIVGHVVSEESHLSYVSVAVKGTTLGTVTDETGHFQLINVPTGPLVIVATAVGYKPSEKMVVTEEGNTTELKFELEEDVLQLEEVVVSADRSRQKRTEAPVIVNTVSPLIFNSSQSVNLAESLNFSPGLRLENNCQNCGFTQVRMNGLEGPYSQILINSRPIFSGLAGVYGLELIPANMIEKVEVVRGGGSALFGSNAIAGTINIILKDPVTNSYELGGNYAFATTGDEKSPDYSLNFNTSLVSDNLKTGLSLYGFTRDRSMFDANGDGFSEIAPMKNLTMGSRFFHRFGDRNRLSLDFFNTNEERDGGNMQDFPLHERDVAEAVEHDLKTAAITFEQYVRDYDLISVYASGQYLVRDSYYGANHSLKDYGNSSDRSYNTGIQYKAVFANASLISGIERTGGFLKDRKLGYPDYENANIVNDSIMSVPHSPNTLVSSQSSHTTGFFSQYDIKFERIRLSVGARYDNYEIKDLVKEGAETKTGNVVSPRLSMMYEINRKLQARLSYSQGYRAPQIFDEDLHIETSGSRQVINVNDPGLKQETSHSIMASLDFNGLIGTVMTGLLAEGFYTRLEDPFVNEIGQPDEQGRVLYTRMNAENGAIVSGINIEFKLKPLQNFYLSSGFTFQKSMYDEPQEFDEKRFFRTPDSYGYFVTDWDFAKDFCLSASGNYTGKMLVPYFGPETNPEEGELRESNPFFDLGLKLKYTIDMDGPAMECFMGVKNIFNSYQSDFDTGINRDPTYIYGPVNPRMVYFGFRIGNLLGE